MKTQKTNFVKPQSAFTLIELLVVIAVIGVLAAILLPVFSSLKIKATVKRIQGEMKLVENAIDAYKENVGVYPTENSKYPATNALYYELAGSKLVGGEYQPLSGSGNITVAGLASFFGPANTVSGFVNVTRGSGDELKPAKNCLTGLRPAQYLEVVIGGVSGIVLGTRANVPAPLLLSDAAGQNINPWRYLSSSATNNAGRYDLWVDVIISGKTNRFSNWRERNFTL